LTRDEEQPHHPSSEDTPETMADLLRGEGGAYRHLRRGDTVEGVVAGFSRDGVLVDVGAKSEGLIPRYEMLSLGPEGERNLKTGDTVTVYVLRPETGEGPLLLSLDRARGETGWRLLQEWQQSGKAFEAPVVGYNKGGLILNVEGVRAFLPVSQMAAAPERGSGESLEKALSAWMGKTLLVKAMEVNRRRGRAIVSERAALQERRSQRREELLRELQEGEVRTGRITSIRDFGIFVDLGGAEGLVPLSEISWEASPLPPQSVFHVGEEVRVFVMRLDRESGRISLSLRRAQGEQWEAMVAPYREGEIVPGLVTKLTSFGAFVRLGGQVEGLIHISELADRHLQHPSEVVREGDLVPVRVLRIERERRRLSLSLRQAREEAEARGWVFDERGAVAAAPPEVEASLRGDR